MSADNGFILRRNKDDKFVLQEYSASSEELPDINGPRIVPFASVEDALIAYEEIQETRVVEYGLTVKIMARHLD